MKRSRAGSTLIELLVVVGTFGVLVGLLLPAVQKVRAATTRAACQNNLRQLALGLHGRHDVECRLPPGTRPNLPDEPHPSLAWHTAVLPHLEQGPLASVVDGGARRPGAPYPKRRPGQEAVVPLFGCPADSRTSGPAYLQAEQAYIGLTSYLGNLGTSFRSPDGVLYLASRVMFGQVSDGLSNTLLVGERPPSFDGRLGWWHHGVGQMETGSLDATLGVREWNGSERLPYSACPTRTPYHFRASRWDNPCAVFHFWSLHPGGANFAFCDGSVRFLPYSADAVLPALATRAGGEVVALD